MRPSTHGARLAIVGNSAAALSALQSFRRVDRNSSVTLVCEEPGPAYSRVLLPYYLRRRIPYEGLFIRDEGSYRRQRVDTLFGTRVDALDHGGRCLELSGGGRLSFELLLLATGSRPVRPLIPGLEGPRVLDLSTLDDAVRLDRLLFPGARALVVGAGFVALQAAWAARQRGLEVTVVEAAERILPRVLDPAAAEILSGRIVASGVALYTCASVDGLEHGADGGLEAQVRGLEPFAVDLVIVGTGVRPNTDLLGDLLCAPGSGIPVDAEMRTELPGVFAAGDVTCGPVCGGGPPEVHALWSTAVEHGRVAGLNLAGSCARYSGSLSMNVTEMFGVTVASLGSLGDAGLGGPDRDREYRDLEGITYLKVVHRGDVPVGAVALGGPEAGSILGKLRPYVRQGRPLPDIHRLRADSSPEYVERAGRIGRDMRRVTHSLDEEVVCAS